MLSDIYWPSSISRFGSTVAVLVRNSDAHESVLVTDPTLTRFDAVCSEPFDEGCLIRSDRFFGLVGRSLRLVNLRSRSVTDLPMPRLLEQAMNDGGLFWSQWHTACGRCWIVRFREPRDRLFCLSLDDSGALDASECVVPPHVRAGSLGGESPGDTLFVTGFGRGPVWRARLKGTATLEFDPKPHVEGESPSHVAGLGETLVAVDYGNRLVAFDGEPPVRPELIIGGDPDDAVDGPTSVARMHRGGGRGMVFLDADRLLFVDQMNGRVRLATRTAVR
ncbi:MAG: hypothetical protein IPJ34_32185 [Myxococcales bacterium]|nr:hypothetical protein [Myxococcales bacterium]